MLRLLCFYFSSLISAVSYIHVNLCLFVEFWLWAAHFYWKIIWENSLKSRINGLSFREEFHFFLPGISSMLVGPLSKVITWNVLEWQKLCYISTWGLYCDYDSQRDYPFFPVFLRDILCILWVGFRDREV